jgi:parallel beta-helix repeat protein
LKRTVSGIMLILLLNAMLTLLSSIQPVRTEPATIIVPDNYPTIQEAINKANPGDTIYVRTGNYSERVIVNKRVTLIGEDRSTTIIDGGNIGTVVSVTANNVSISRFTVRNSGSGTEDNGIRLEKDFRFAVIVDNNIVENNNGIFLEESNNNFIHANNIMNNTLAGIHLDSSYDNTMRANNITNNRGGIVPFHSYDNIIYHNKFINNVPQFSSYGSKNVWHKGYPSGGNYWSDYTGVDLYHGPYQNETGSDGIWDKPYNITDVVYGLQQDRYPLVSNASIHDIAVTNVTVSQMEVRQGDYFLDINATIENMGDYIENSTITLYYNSSVITNKIIDFRLDAMETLPFPWNVTGVTPGVYAIKANATRVSGETNIANNEFVYGTVRLVNHNVAITEVKVKYGKTFVGQNYTCDIYVTVANTGDFTETFNVTLEANATAIDTITVDNLPNGTSTILTFTWNTTGFLKGNYTLIANATKVLKEKNETDNTLPDGWVKITVPCDMDDNGITDLSDILEVALRFGSTSEDPGDRWDSNWDIDGNGIVDISDILEVALHYGETDP